MGYKFKVRQDASIKEDGNCLRIAEREVAYLQGLGYKAEVVHCVARCPYDSKHAIAKAYIDGKWWIVPDYVIMDIPWEYDAVKHSCYAFLLP